MPRHSTHEAKIVFMWRNGAFLPHKVLTFQQHLIILTRIREVKEDGKLVAVIVLFLLLTDVFSLLSISTSSLVRPLVRPFILNKDT